MSDFLPPMIAPYVGRFAPSPTGALHLGSLLSAVAGYCDAKAHQGLWLVRIEDIDPLREIPGASADILHTLENYGLHWDGEVLYQSQRNAIYQQALDELMRAGHAFYCTCSRKQLSDHGHSLYPGTCRQQRSPPAQDCAVKAIVPEAEICFDDAIQGHVCLQFGVEAGDFVIRRKEGFFAYHLAVVVDDAAQRITDIVRGCDLLDSTPYHLLLQRWLQVASPHYAHLPVLTNAQGHKLSKQTFARALPSHHTGLILYRVLVLLGQQPDKHLQNECAITVLDWGIHHWNRNRIPHTAGINAESLQGV